jgi:hypothetical protein
MTEGDEAHCDICNRPIKDSDLCATDVDLGPCHATCLEGSPIVNRETGEVILDAKPDIYRYDGLPVSGADQ